MLVPFLCRSRDTKAWCRAIQVEVNRVELYPTIEVLRSLRIKVAYDCLWE